MNNFTRIVVPLILGLIAGVVNFVVVRGLATPKELVAASVDLKENTLITDVNNNTQIVKFTIRTENQDLFKTAVPWAERGSLLNRRISRSITKGEAILYADIPSEGSDNILSQLKPNEKSYTIEIRQSRIAPGMKINDMVVFFTMDDEDPTPAEGVTGIGEKPHGPYRVVALANSSSEAFRGAGGEDEIRKVSFALSKEQFDDVSKHLSVTNKGRRITRIEYEKIEKK